MYDDIKTACLYVRYSSANQTEQSIEGQIRVCRDFCDRHGIRIVEIYADRATSASKDIEKRVNFLKMIKDSEKHNFEAVIVYKLDRFSRSRYDMANFKYRLRKNGVQLISATENISNDPEGIILESVLEGMAEFYSAELSQKINRGLRESAFKHNSLGGQIPLGYKTEGKKLVIDEETAPIIREAFSMYAEGHSVAEICRLFNAKGYKTSKGARFGKSSFSKIFRNERYIGVYQFHDYRAEDVIPAIIDKKTFDQVQARLKTNGKAPGRNKAQVIYLLTGKLYCGHCGSHMNASSNTSGYYYYQCYGKKNLHKDCSKKNLRKDFIEGIVVRDAMSLLTDENIDEIATGYKTSKGARFGKSSFSKIFRNERYIGVYQFHDYRAEDVIPAIIDKKTFDQVQARLKTNGKAPGRNKAQVIYLLTGKLYCGHCGSHMNASSNTSGYYYYQCYGKKNLHKDCSKKNLRKDFIEGIVVRDAMSLLTDENIDEIATIAVRTNNREVESTTNIPALRDRLHETRVSLTNLTKAIESGLAPEALVKRMVELEKEQKVIEAELKNEEKDVVHLEKAQVVYWLEQFKQGDIDDDDFRRLLIDLFVHSVTVWDEEDDYFKITIGYNLTSLENKTYRLTKGGTSSDFALNPPVCQNNNSVQVQ